MTLGRFLSALFLGIGLLPWMPSYGQADFSAPLKHSFKDEIIRSYAINPFNSQQILVGMKGQKAGAGKVHYSPDGGTNWIALNNGKALCDSCEDVQAVCFFDENTFLAGTWKNGLYISKDKGQSFSKIGSFPAPDIRAIKKSNKHVLLAATTTHGIMQSGDGTTWLPLHDTELNKTLASWSFEVDPDAKDLLYALTFGNGIYKTIDHGKTWKEMVHKDGIMIWDMDFYGQTMYAIGSDDTSSYILKGFKGDKDWTITPIDVVGANSININEHPYHISLLIGTWGSGIYDVSVPGDIIQYSCTDVLPLDSVASTKIWSNDSIIHHFTWGDGLRTYQKKEDCLLNIPEAWTPNGDGIFDPGISSNCELDFLSFKLYNRWGEFIFEHKGEVDELNQLIREKINDFEAGTYVYWVKFSFDNQEKTLQNKGHISVVR